MCLHGIDGSIAVPGRNRVDHGGVFFQGVPSCYDVVAQPEGMKVKVSTLNCLSRHAVACNLQDECVQAVIMGAEPLVGVVAGICWRLGSSPVRR